MIDHKTAAQVQEAGAILHGPEFLVPEKVLILLLAIDMERDHVGDLQQFAEGYRTRIAAGQDVRGIVEHDAHSHGLSQIG